MSTLHNTRLDAYQAKSLEAEQLHEASRLQTELWLAVYLPDLALESSCCDYRDRTFALVRKTAGKHYIYQASPLAERCGVNSGMQLQAAYAVCAELQTLDYDPVVEQETLQELARQALEFSPRVNLAPPSAFLLEISGSIKYFGSLAIIRKGLSEKLAANGVSCFRLTITPTSAASLLLARTGREDIISDPAELRSRLGPVAIHALPLNKKHLGQLKKIGVRVLRDLWRLPENELARRFDRDFIHYLQALLGRRREFLPVCYPSLQFEKELDLVEEISENLKLLPPAQLLLDDFSAFLRRRDIYANHFSLYLKHGQYLPTSINFVLRQAVRSSAHFMLLVETDFQKRRLPAPVNGIKIFADQFHDFTGRSFELFKGADGASDQDGGIDTLLEQLQVRLGQDMIRGLVFHADHRPEYAGFLSRPQPCSPPETGKPRPLWLLPAPRRLQVKKNRLYYRSLVHFLMGPERIETGWWDNFDIQRDYYIGMDEQAGLLWIYRDLKEKSAWYLHGLFG